MFWTVYASSVHWVGARRRNADWVDPTVFNDLWVEERETTLELLYEPLYLRTPGSAKCHGRLPWRLW